jgi:hypothetical protein
MQDWRYGFARSQTRDEIQASGQLRNTAVLTPGEKNGFLLEMQRSRPVWMLRRKEKCMSLSRIESRLPHSLPKPSQCADSAIPIIRRNHQVVNKSRKCLGIDTSLVWNIQKGWEKFDGHIWWKAVKWQTEMEMSR